eukprot:1330152-Prymnesium_polylepis.1
MYIESSRDALKESVLTHDLSRITAVVSGSSRKSPSLRSLGSPSLVICDTGRHDDARSDRLQSVRVRGVQGRAGRRARVPSASGLSCP